jgi:hypothetical protein
VDGHKKARTRTKIQARPAAASQDDLKAIGIGDNAMAGVRILTGLTPSAKDNKVLAISVLAESFSLDLMINKNAGLSQSILPV